MDQNDSIPRKYSRTCVDKEFSAAEKLGIRLCFGRGSLDLGPEDGNNISPELLQTVDEIIADSEDAIKKYHDGNFNSMKNVILAPCAPFCSSKECYIKTAELARKYKVRLNTHLAETLDEEKWCKEKYSKRPLELMQECNFIGNDVFFNHGIHFTEEEIKFLAKTGTGVAHCPTSNMKLSSGIMKMKEMRKYGVTIGLGVDGSASNDGSNLLDEMRNCFLLHRLNESHDAPTGYDILKMVTRGSAKLIGREELGCLKIGNPCDLFMIKCKGIEMVGCDHDFKNYLCTVGHKGNVFMTIVNGKIVFKDGKLTNIENEEELELKAREVENEYLNKKYDIKKTIFIAAFLFGLWHLVTPFRSLLDGDMNLLSFIVMSIGYVILSTIMGIKWGLLYKMTGSIWMGLADHFFNNCVVTNLLHVVTSSGVDEMQIARVLIGELTSFIAVLIYMKVKNIKIKSLESKCSEY